jgi:hypothetical protein
VPLEEPAHRAGGDSEHDIVDRGAETALDPLEVAERSAGPRKVTPR